MPLPIRACRLSARYCLDKNRDTSFVLLLKELEHRTKDWHRNFLLQNLVCLQVSLFLLTIRHSINCHHLQSFSRYLLEDAPICATSATVFHAILCIEELR